MQGYLYITDEAGEEIEGSRRYLSGCKTYEAFLAIRSDLEAKAGDGCTVRDSIEDRE